MLRRGRPFRGVWHPGEWVMYFRRKANVKGHPGMYLGPARVIVQESAKLVWLSHTNMLIRCSPEQLRMATSSEKPQQDAPTTVPTNVPIPDPPSGHTGHNQFIDLTSQGPPPSDHSSHAPGPEPHTPMEPQPELDPASPPEPENELPSETFPPGTGTWSHRGPGAKLRS